MFDQAVCVLCVCVLVCVCVCVCECEAWPPPEVEKYMQSLLEVRSWRY